MHIDRRNFLKVLPLGGLFSEHFLSTYANVNNSTNQLPNNLQSSFMKKNIDKIYDEAIVIDGIVITRNWSEVSDRALAKSGYTGFNASLDSGSLTRALKSIAEWQKRIKENPDRFICATSADDFIQAKKEDKVAVMLGFQNTTMLENSIDNLDVFTNFLELLEYNLKSKVAGNDNDIQEFYVTKTKKRIDSFVQKNGINYLFLLILRTSSIINN